MEYPLTKFHFQVDWGGVNIGFTEVSGLEVTTDKIEYRHGASPEYIKTQMPGMQSFSEITLKRGTFAGDNEFYTWWNTVTLGKVDRRDITVSMLDENHEPVVIFKIKNAWPTKVTPTDLNATSNEVAVETLVLVHEGLTIEYA